MPEPILIIDFDAQGLEATRACLRAAGLTADVVGSPRAFSLALRTSLPPVVILEPVLPGLDGFRICEALKKGVGGRVPVVVLASRQMAEEMFSTRARQAGADWVLELPRDEPEMVAVCRDAIGSLPEIDDASAPDPAPEPPPARPAREPIPRRSVSHAVAPPLAAAPPARPLDLAEEDVDLILDSAFAGTALSAPLDGPDAPAHRAPGAPERRKARRPLPPPPQQMSPPRPAWEPPPMRADARAARPIEPPAPRPVVPPSARPAVPPAARALEPPPPRLSSSRSEPPIFDVADTPAEPVHGARAKPAEHLFSDGPSIDPDATIPLARTPELEAMMPHARPASPPRPHPPRAPKPAPVAPRAGRPGTRRFLMVLFTLGCGAAGYLTWAPAPPVPLPRTAERGETAGRGAARDDGAPNGVAKDEDRSESTPAQAAAETAGAGPAEAAATDAEVPEAQPEGSPVEPAPDAPEDASAGGSADTSAAADAEREPVTKPIAVLKPPIADPDAVGIQPQVINRTLPEPIAGTQVDPLYPQAAREARLPGRVRMAVTVAPDGRVSDVAVLEESERGVGFGRAAVAAVRQWRFRPAMRQGEPHAATVEIALEFNP